MATKDFVAIVTLGNTHYTLFRQNCNLDLDISVQSALPLESAPPFLLSVVKVAENDNA